MSSLPRTLALLSLVSCLLPPRGFSAKNAGTTILCETQGGEQEKARVVVKTPSGHTLFVCGKILTKKGKTELSSFRVFALGKSGKRIAGHVFQDSSDQNHYRLGDAPDALALQELIWNGRERIPAFETRIECSEAGCKKLPATCVLPEAKATPSKTMAQLKPYLHGAKKGKVPSKELIGRVAGLAYAGDKEALALFQNRGNLFLDGEAADAYFDHQTMLQRLRNSGCMKNPADTATPASDTK